VTHTEGQNIFIKLKKKKATVEEYQPSEKRKNGEIKNIPKGSKKEKENPGQERG